MNRRLFSRPVAAVAAAALAVLAALPAPASAQGTTREQIDRAIAMYNNFQVEAARPILLNIISPNYLQQVLPAERVDAYKYLGASYALLGHADTAATFFRAALDFDPFTDLDVELFSATELAAFNEAKKQIFKVGVAPIVNHHIVPSLDTTAYVFRLITTKRGIMTVTILSQPDTSRVREVLFQDSNEGLRQLRWNGVRSNGQFADTGIYVVRVEAREEGGSNSVQGQQFFRLEHHFEALEDELPPFRPDQLLPDRVPTAAPYLDFVKGLLAAGASFGIATATLNSDVVGWQAHAAGAGAVGLVAGTWSFLYRRANRSIGPNVAENNRRIAERNAFNNAVRARNQARLDRREIIITPLAGFSR
jgi:hypothetical protein